ncbi:MAG: uracil-DNA glycosylase [Proteobacteria bacterium]|nr:MAG: uracil-DNA glycosylase [Pseudomonadota bacterium]
MDRSLAAELRAAVETAREQLRDWLEEGVEAFERSAAQQAAFADVAEPAPAPREPRPARKPREAEPTRTAPAPSVAAPRPFGPHPTLDEVRASLGDCRRCRLAEGRTQLVFGDGNPEADILFVGEGPGEQEDLQGLPFVGRAGELLTQMIERGLGIARRSVYICNIVKCRPPQNRTPLADEVSTCRPFLDGQIDAVRPKVIVALGKPATSLLLGRDVSITRVRGVWQDYRGFAVMPTFHPAFVLRQYTPENRRLVWEDLKSALGRARELGGRFE